MGSATGWTSLAVALWALAALVVIRLCRVVEQTLARIADRDPMHAHDPGHLDHRVDDGRAVDRSLDVWSDDVLAANEREMRTTAGADPWYVDTFGLEEDERAYQREQDVLRARAAARPYRPD